MPSSYAIIMTALHCLLAFGLNQAVNWSFNTSGPTTFIFYLVVLVLASYERLIRLSKMIVIDAKKLEEVLKEELTKQIKEETKK